MPSYRHVATINAFENKYGTYTGAIRDEATKEVTRERFNTYDEAKNWARTEAWNRFGPVKYAYIRRKNEYLSCVWKDVEVS